MPQQRKRKTAEEILGIAPQRKSAEEILGIAPRPQPAPTPQPEQSLLEAFQGGGAGALNDYIVDPALSLYSAGKAAVSGDFGPAAGMLESVARGAGQLLMGGNPSFAKPAQANTEALGRLQAERTARQAKDPLFENTRIVREQLAREAATDSSFANKAARFAGGAAVGAAPAVATGILTGGSVPSVAGITALQSAGQPETAALNVGLSAVPIPPILKRIRAGRNVGAAVEKAPISAGPIRRTGAVADLAAEQAGIRAQTGVARLEAPQTLPSRPNLADEGLPILEEAELRPFEVSLGKERVRQPGATGPRFDEAVEFELGKKAGLVAKEERTPILETISALRKAGLLTGLRTHLKNVGGTGLFQLSEEAARIPGAIADMVVGKVTGRRTLTGPSLGSVGRSAYEAATTGIAEAKKAIRTGQTKYDLEGLKEIASGSKVIDTYVNGVFRTLKAEDAVFRAYAVRRSLEDRARALAITEARQGKITRGQIGERTRELTKAPPADMEAAALLDAEVATFNNPNVVADAISAGIEKLPKGGQFVADQIVPFRKTPTNVIFRMLESSPLGFGKNAYQLARGIAKKSFTEAEQRAFSQTFGRASLGSGLIALGYIGYRDGWLTGLIEDEPSRRARDMATGRQPGSIKIGNTWYQLTGFAPFGPLLAIGATLARETEQEQEGTGTLPALEVAGQAIGEQPLLVGTKQVAEALAKPGSVGERFLGGYLGSTVPAMASDIAEAFDPTQREATGITGRAQSRIPGARNLLPPAQDVLGQPRQDFGAAQAFLDPTRATTDVASENPLFAELVRLDVGVSGFEKKKDETGAKGQALGALYIPYGLQLVSSPEYRQASDELRREAVKRLNSRAKLLVEENRQAYAAGTLTPAALLAAAADSIRKEETRKNAGRK